MIEYEKEDENTCWRCKKKYTENAFPTNSHQALKRSLCKHCSANLSSNITVHNKNAKKWGVEGHLTLLDWLQILHISHGRCHYCRKAVGFSQLVIEHMIPMVAGGTNSFENIVASCAQCNVKKARRNVEEWQQSIETELLLTTLQNHLQLPTNAIINLALKALAHQKGIEIQGGGEK